MTETITEGTATPSIAVRTPLGSAQAIATGLPSALSAGSRAYVNGVLELSRTLGGFGREVAAEAGRHVRATIDAKCLREAAELQAAWLQHRVETSTAHAKEFADLASAKAMDVIAPVATLLKQDKPA